ncbi:PEP-CTERM sorting domain-containing protein [Nostoc sp. CALU 546]|uniref:PEP-CTERM sorting domain-containing protein n=1 Tax=Nostoc sp. CALU 546 TaxID=1867241 RepID=UPI003B6703DF
MIKIAADGTRTTLLSGNGLESPSALTIGADGAVYVTNRSDRPGLGQVIRIENTKSIPEPSSAFGVFAIAAFGVAWLHKKRSY